MLTFFFSDVRMRGISVFIILRFSSVKGLLFFSIKRSGLGWGHCWYSSYLPTPPLGQDMTQGQFLSGVLTVFLLLDCCLTKAEELSLPYYIHIAGGRINWIIHFPWVLVLCETLSVSSRMWTGVAVSISYDDNHYTTGNSLFLKFIRIYLMIYFLNLKHAKPNFL